MKAKNVAVRVVIVLSALLTGAFLVANLLLGNSTREAGISASAGQTIFLARPAFAQGMDTSFLDAEAGVSAYITVGQEIDLEMATIAFRTIEYETDEYIVGSVPLPDYPETEDVHAFVHGDGWIVSYYLRDEPTAKIVDWAHYGGEEITGTKLEEGIFVVCDAAAVPIGDIKYYHFRYISANKVMIVAEAVGAGEDTFRIKLPSDFMFYERSYSHYASVGDCWYESDYAQMYLDEEMISGMGTATTKTKYGLLSLSQLSSGVFHTIRVAGSCIREGNFGAIVLIYQEP